MKKKPLYITFTIAFILTACRADISNYRFQTNIINAMELSHQEKKPLFIHFTCFTCVGRSEFRNKFATSKKIQNMLNEEFVAVEIYVDDRTKFKEQDMVSISTLFHSVNGKARLAKSRTIGSIHNAFEIELLEKNTQPQYVITNYKLDTILSNFGYLNGNENQFYERLEEGLIMHKNCRADN